MAIPTKQAGYVTGGIGMALTLATVIGIGDTGFIFGPLAAFFFFLTLMIFKYGYWVVPLLTSGARVVETQSKYETPPTRDCVIKPVGDLYEASVFLEVKIYESVTEKTSDELRLFTDYFERAISGVKYLVKFSMMVYVKDLSVYKEQIIQKRSEAQMRLQKELEKENPDPAARDRFETEKALWTAQLERMKKGIPPMGSLCYVMTTATGVSRDSARSAAIARGNEIRSTIANSLNATVVQLEKDAMLKCFEWEFLIPASAKMEGD